MLCVCASVWGGGYGVEGISVFKGFQLLLLLFFFISTEKDADSEDKEPCVQV